MSHTTKHKKGGAQAKPAAVTPAGGQAEPVKKRAVNLACTLAGTLAIFAVFYYFFYGMPLLGMPKAENVVSISVQSAEGMTATITDEENIEILVNAASLLNYRFRKAAADEPELTVCYELADGSLVTLSASRQTVWWNGTAHPLKEEEVFSNIIEGLYLDGDTSYLDSVRAQAEGK